jgi:hypothetical protein
VTAARHSAIALLPLAGGLLALLLSPGGRIAPAPTLATRAAVEAPRALADQTTTTRTHHHHHTSTDTFSCPSRFIDILPPDDCPTETPAPAETFTFTNSAASVSIPPTATPRPVPTAAPTPVDTPFPTDVGSGPAATDTTTSITGPAALPASGGGRRSGGGGLGVPILAALGILVLLGGTAGLAVLRLR